MIWLAIFRPYNIKKDLLEAIFQHILKVSHKHYKNNLITVSINLEAMAIAVITLNKNVI